MIEEVRGYSGRWVQCATYRGGCWIRLCGIGVSAINRSRHPALFSERYGYCKVLRIGRYAIRYLPALTKAKGK